MLNHITPTVTTLAVRAAVLRSHSERAASRTHGLGVVHQAISYQDDDPAEDDQGGRHPRLVPADVQHGFRQLGIDLLESALQARPPPDRAPQSPPQDDRCHQHHDGLQRVGGGDRSESAGGRVEGGRHGDGSDQPPGGAPPLGQDREGKIEREGDIAQDVGAVLDLNEGAQQAGTRTEAVFQVLGIGEHAAAVERQEYEVGRHHPADRQPQPPGGQVGEPEGIGPADHGHVIPAVHGGGEHRQPHHPPGQALGGQQPVGGTPGATGEPQPVADDGAVGGNHDEPVQQGHEKRIE